MLSVGVLGFGYWGPNIARAIAASDMASLTAICDTDRLARAAASRAHPHASVVATYEELLALPVDVVAIATPVLSHFELASAALRAGKHVFVEKPFTSTSEQAMRLVDLAAHTRLSVMVGHIFLFTPQVRRVAELLAESGLGRLTTIESTRLNAGPIRADVNVIWDLAAHDFSIVDHVVSDRPTAVSATGQRVLGGEQEDVASIKVYFASGVVGRFDVSWIAPQRTRELVLVGSERKLVWDGGDTVGKSLYVVERDREKVEQVCEGQGEGMDSVGGDGVSREPLWVELDYFFDCVNAGRQPHNDAEAGLRNVQSLEATTRSLTLAGEPIELGALV